jgi:hypothetical protein
LALDVFYDVGKNESFCLSVEEGFVERFVVGERGHLRVENGVLPERYRNEHESVETNKFEAPIKPSDWLNS